MFSASPKKARRWKVPMRIWPWLSRASTAERVGEGSSPRSSSSPVSNKAKVFDVLTPERFEHLGREHFAHAALQRQPAVAGAAVGRLARALGAEVEQAVLVVAQLREEEAAAVADVGVVHAELVAVIAQRQRLRRGCRAAARSGRNAPPSQPRRDRSPTRSAQRSLQEARDALRESAPARPDRRTRCRASGSRDRADNCSSGMMKRRTTAAIPKHGGELQAQMLDS